MAVIVHVYEDKTGKKTLCGALPTYPAHKHGDYAKRCDDCFKITMKGLTVKEG